MTRIFGNPLHATERQKDGKIKRNTQAQQIQMIPWFAKRYIVPYGKPKTNVSVIQEPSSKVVNLNTQGRIILAKKERAGGGVA